MLFSFDGVALNGIRDLVLKHPSELKLQKLSIIEKLRERISDSDKLVRETLYNLLKTVIFPSLKEVFYYALNVVCYCKYCSSMLFLGSIVDYPVSGLKHNA